jgi:D-beta-D-heptose 7-phosphate kinase/D-beta-D-heptose 1-phosphate adenosyltransferase
MTKCKKEKGSLKKLVRRVLEAGLGNVLAELAPDESDPKILTSADEAAKVIKKAKKEGKTVAFASGCFDILHAGHIMFFRDAKKDVDMLIVAVDANSNVSGAKGSDHPMFDETERLIVVAALQTVDYAFLFSGSCAELVQKLKPTCFCFGPFDPRYKEKKKDAEKAGAKVKEAGFSLKAWSSSRVAASIRNSFLLLGKWVA